MLRFYLVVAGIICNFTGKANRIKLAFMKRLLLFFAVAVGIVTAAVTVGCGPKQGESVYFTNCVYVNDCSSEISITIHSDMQYDLLGMEDYSQIVVPPNEQCEIPLVGEGGYRQPFFWVYGDEYVTVSNGEITVTQTPRNDELFLMEKYIPISEANRTKVISFVFTDEFFED